MSRKKTPIIEINPELLALAQRRGFSLAPLKIHGELLFFVKDGGTGALFYDGKSFYERELLSLLRREVKS